jgi:hypothetical protein
VGREGEAKVGLGKRGNGTTEGKSHGSGGRGVNLDRNESTFVEVDGEASCCREIVKSRFKIDDMVRDSADDDQGIISVLKNRARKIIDKGVEEEPITTGLEEELLEDVGNDVEKEGG